MEQYNQPISLHKFIDSWIWVIMDYSASINSDGFAYRSEEQYWSFYTDCRMKSRIPLSPSAEDIYASLYYSLSTTITKLAYAFVLSVHSDHEMMIFIMIVSG